MSLPRVVWSIFWRLMVVLIINASINFAIAHLSYWLTPQSVLSVMIRGSLAFLPAALIFAILSVLAGRGVFVLLERRSGLDGAQWRQTYIVLAICCLAIIAIVSLLAVVADVEYWLNTRNFLPVPFLLLVCFGLSIFQSRKVRSSP